MREKKFSKISEILKDAKRGKMFVLVDDEKRENEGDLVIPASKVTAQSINFMAKYGRGLICLSLTQSQVNKLNLSLMSPINNTRTQTAFTVSIDARKGISSGISAHDRALTIKTAIKKIDLIGKSWFINFKLLKKYNKYLVQKGSIAINGVSLTISKILKDGFQVVVIPKTLKLTNLIYIKEKDVVNVEFDVLGKYIKSILK